MIEPPNEYTKHKTHRGWWIVYKQVGRVREWFAFSGDGKDSLGIGIGRVADMIARLDRYLQCNP